MVSQLHTTFLPLIHPNRPFIQNTDRSYNSGNQSRTNKTILWSTVKPLNRKARLTLDFTGTKRTRVKSARTFALLFSTVFAVAFAQPAQQFTTTHYGLREGLTNSNVNCLIQDSYGLVWAGTAFGLYRYDGLSWKNYRNTLTNEPPGNANVSCLLEDEKSNLWVGKVDKGLQYFERKTAKWTDCRGRGVGKIPSNDIWDLYRDPAGTLWVASDSGLFYKKYNAQKFEKLLALSDPRQMPQKLTCARSGNIWAIVGKSVVQFAPSPFKEISRSFISNKLMAGQDIALEPDGESGIVISAPGMSIPFVFRVQADGSVEEEQLPQQSKSIPLILQDQYIVLANGETWCFKQSNRQLESNKLSVTESVGKFVSQCANGVVFSQILRDRQTGIWWIGTSNGVFKVVATNAFLKKVALKNLDDKNIRAIADVGGRIILASTTKLLELRKDHTVAALRFSYNGKNELYNPSSLRTNTLFVLSKDSLLVCATSGLYLLDFKTMKLSHFGPKFRQYDKTEPSARGVWCADRLADSKIWIGQQFGGFHHFYLKDRDGKHNDSIIEITENDKVQSIWSLLRDRKERLWIGSGNGLSRINTTSNDTAVYLPSSKPNSICGSNIWGIVETTNKTIWVNCFGNGISRYREKTNDFVSYTAKDGYPFETICSIIPQGDDTLWLSSYNGLYRFIPSTKSVLALYTEDGLHDNVFGLKSACRLRDGRMFFGGTTGLTELSNPNSIFDRFRPRVLLTSIQCGDSTLARDIISNSEIEIAHDQNSLLFSFAMMDLRSPLNNRVEYYLEGVDKSWMQDGGRGQVAFSNLSPGSYRLHLRASNSQGQNSSNELVVTVNVIPAWWQTVWFQVGTFLGVGLLVVGFLQRRKNQRDRFNKALELVRLRERRVMASDIHDGPLQDLFGLKMLVESPLIQSHEIMEGVLSVTRKVRNELTIMCAELRPVKLKRTLSESLEELLKSFATAHPSISFSSKLLLDDHFLTSDQRDALFFVARTAITNVIKHSEADRAELSVISTPKALVLELRDNGVGFDDTADYSWKKDSSSQEGVDQKFGLDICREFARVSGGEFKIQSQPGNGTTVRLTLKKQTWLDRLFLIRVFTV